MKTLLFIALSTIFFFSTYAQEGTIRVEQNPKLKELLEIYKSAQSKSGFYQIQVGFGTYQTAQDLKSKVELDFPYMETKIEFESPTYRVRLGKFYDMLDAERNFREVRKKYPNAMLLKPENKRNRNN